MSDFQIWLINSLVTLYRTTGINIAPSEALWAMGVAVIVGVMVAME